MLLRAARVGLISQGRTSLRLNIRVPTSNVIMPLNTKVANYYTRSYLSKEDDKEDLPSDAELEELIRNEKAKLDIDDVKEDEVPDKLIEENEQVISPSQTQEFKAETKKILDIVARSLYSDKEFFVRELISNASDALEKIRHIQLTNAQAIAQPELPLEIQISVDDKKKTFTIQDTGVGMTKEELIKHLGSIGYSGTSEFMKVLEDKEKASNLIGQFGVGFYSVFMVANKVRVYSRSAKDQSSKGYVWESDGSGSYSVAEAEPVQRGTKIVLYLKNDSDEYATKQAVETVIKTYSNFVGFPISVNGKQINTVGALWTKLPKEVTPEQHKEFYQFISKAHDSPQYTLHFQTDTPLSLRAVFYVPETHMEKYGMGRQEVGVSLFSRKILIQGKCKGLVPDWMRFVKGVVDSEDVPLNLSREHLQDNALIKRLSGVLTKRFLKFLEKESQTDKKKYEGFYQEFQNYLKEGISTDYINKEDIAKLLRYESSFTSNGEFTSLTEYVSRMPKEQTEIYYLSATNRSLAEDSPYFETFKESGTEVLFFFDRVDDLVMADFEFQGKRLKSAESSSAQPPKKTGESEDGGLSREDFAEFTKWMKEVLVDKITTVTRSDRLVTTPCIIVDHENASFRRMMQMVYPKTGNMPTIPKQQVQINAKHPLITKINELRSSQPDVAKEAIFQIYDNALIQAGLVDDSRSMIPRINRLLEYALTGKLQRGAVKEEIERIDDDDPFRKK